MFINTSCVMKKEMLMVKRIMESIPSVEFTVGSGWGASMRRRILAFFLVDEAARNNGVFMDKSQNGIVMFYPTKGKKEACWKARLMLIFFAIGPFRIGRVLKRRNEVQKMRSKFPSHIYCSFLGVLPESRGTQAIFELRDILFQKSKELQLPVMVETVIIKNKKVYERIGFKTYSQIEIDGMITYCMIRDCDK